MAKPAIKKPSGKGAPPPPSKASNNLEKDSSTQMVQLHLKISAEQRRDFKAYALERDMDANELFLIIWDAYRDKNS